MRVLVVDDHVMVTELVAGRLTQPGFAVQQCHAPENVASILECQPPDVLLLDISFANSQLTGFHLLDQVHRSHPGMPVIMVSMYSDRVMQAEAFNRGASGYIPKNLPYASIVEAIFAVLSGGTWFHASRQDSAGGRVLTPRQRAVVSELASGRTEKEIAEDLGVCVSTVEFHLKRARHALCARTTKELVRLATEQGLLLIPDVSVK